jgi:hypothetical protein
LLWKEEGFYGGNSESQSCSVEPVELTNYDVKAINLKEKKEKGISKKLLRTRKVPVKKSNDFLW